MSRMFWVTRVLTVQARTRPFSSRLSPLQSFHVRQVSEGPKITTKSMKRGPLDLSEFPMVFDSMQTSCRHFTGSTSPAEIDPLKKLFFNMMSKYKTYVYGLLESKIDLDPDDPKAVSGYKSLMDSIRKKLGVPTITEKIGRILDKEAKAAPDVKSFYKKIPELKRKWGITDEYEGDKMMIEAVEKVEKEIGRVLVRTDKEGMSLLKNEFEAINKALYLDQTMVNDLQSQVETECAKAELQAIKNEVVEEMETHAKSLGLEHVKIDLRSLDHRNHL